MRNHIIRQRFLCLLLLSAVTIPLAVNCKSAAKKNAAKVQTTVGEGPNMEVAGSGA